MKNKKNKIKKIREMAVEYALLKGGGAKGHRDFRRLRQLESTDSMRDLEQFNKVRGEEKEDG